MNCDMPIENTIQSWIIRLMHRYSAMNYTKFTELGVHPGQLPVLRVISEREGISQRQLAKVLHIKPPTVAVTVKRLEKAELVCRRTDPMDMRISRMYLSEKGKNIHKEICSLMEENEKILTNGFSEEELDHMRGLIQKMISNLNEMDWNCEDAPNRVTRR